MKTLHKLIRPTLEGQTRSIQRGLSRHTAGFSSGTPIEIDFYSSEPPQLRGLPYLKTMFRRGNFSRSLYTHSTMHVTVGAVWLFEQASKQD